AQHRASRGLGRNREVLDGGPDVAPLLLHHVVDALDHLGPRAEREHLGRAHRPPGREIGGAYRRLPLAQPGPDRPEVVAVERGAPGAEGDDLHAECPRVEPARGRDVLDGEHEVVEALEGHEKMLSGRNADTIQLGASTISLILRSTATLHTAYASSRLSPRAD